MTLAQKRTFNFGGQQVPGEEIEFETERESWNTYILLDGTRLKMKSVVATVVRLDTYGPDGTPVYLVNATNVVSTEVPDGLRKRD